MQNKWWVEKAQEVQLYVIEITTYNNYNFYNRATQLHIDVDQIQTKEITRA